MSLQSLKSGFIMYVSGESSSLSIVLDTQYDYGQSRRPHGIRAEND